LPGNCGNQIDNAPSAAKATRLKTGICQLLRTLLRARCEAAEKKGRSPHDRAGQCAPENQRGRGKFSGEAILMFIAKPKGGNPGRQG
jgi:hypothetical protein